MTRRKAKSYDGPRGKESNYGDGILGSSEVRRLARDETKIDDLSERGCQKRRLLFGLFEVICKDLP